MPVLSVVQEILLRVCCAARPSDTLHELLRRHRAELSDEERSWLTSIDADGLAVTGLLIRQRRLDHLLRGDADFRAHFAAAPQEFAADFLEYSECVESTFCRPEEEARAFRQFLDLLG